MEELGPFGIQCREWFLIFWFKYSQIRPVNTANKVGSTAAGRDQFRIHALGYSLLSTTEDVVELGVLLTLGDPRGGNVGAVFDLGVLNRAELRLRVQTLSSRMVLLP